MATAMESAAQQRFRDTRDKLAVILNDLADVAELRGEMVLNGEAAEGRRSPRKQPLADVLRKKAEAAAARTPFRIAVVGEFSRGKSTLINALLGRDILATNYRPNTAARTVLRYGEPERFRVEFVKELGRAPLVIESSDLKRDLPEFTSDSAVDADYGVLLRGKKKSLAKQILEVQVWCISDFLKAKEMEIIDTPGLGSVFPAHKAVTYEVIPSVDATLFLVQADPGPGESEILFLKYVREYVNQIFFVLTKADMARNRDELEGRLELFRETVESTAGLQVENLYSVSALRALEGQVEESGFGEFLPALETFLVRSSGVERLQVPLHLARTHWGRLSNGVERDVRALDQSLGALRAELDRLLGEEKIIERARDRLLGDVDRRIEELVDLTTDGMEDRLPVLIQRQVEVAVDELGVKQLLKASDHLQLVMKDTVIGWLEQKEDRLRSSAEQLQHRVEVDLRDILDTIEASEALVDYELGVDVMAPQVRGGLWSGVGRSIWGGGASLIVGVGASSILASMLAALSIATGFAIIPLLLSLGGLVVQAPKIFRKRIKEALANPLRRNDVNAYQAIVEGFDQDGRHIQGVRATFEAALRNWGDQLKIEVSRTVTNNLDSRLSQLRRQIEEKESGRQDREQELEKYTRQKEKLHSVGRELDEVAGTVLELSDGRIEDQRRLVEEIEVGGKQKQAGRRGPRPRAKSSGSTKK